jgi:hypothetical protein
MKKPLYVHILLDRSGSMERNRDTTIDAFNEYVNGLRVSKEIDARLSLTLFDSGGIDLVHDAVPIGEFPELSQRDFVPRAMTPLLDAIGHTIAHIKTAKLRADEKVTLAILTDGLENASREYKLADIRAQLEKLQTGDDDWQVLFLGAGIDAIGEAGKLGVGADSAMLYGGGASTRKAMVASLRMQSAYAHAPKGATKPSFTPEERRDAKE